MKSEVIKFLLEANQHGYGSNLESTWKENPDGSHTIEYARGGWTFQDNYFGGEPFGGSEVIFQNGKAVWMMVYYGGVKTDENEEVIIGFLRKALLSPNPDLPVRGPKEFKEGEFAYINSHQGGIERFSGQEVILKKDQEVYSTQYIGGMIGL